MSNHVPLPLIGFRVWTVRIWKKRPAFFARHMFSNTPWLLHETNRAICDSYEPPRVNRIMKTEFWIVNSLTNKPIGPGNTESLRIFREEIAKLGKDPNIFVLRNIVPPTQNITEAEADAIERQNYEAIVPHTRHRCGFNAYYNLDDAIRQEFKVFAPPGCKEDAVIGMIAGSGKVVEHDYGFRSGKAQILCLIDTRQNYSTWRPKQLGKWLNIPVIKPEAIGWFGSLHGECRFEQNLTAGRY